MKIILKDRRRSGVSIEFAKAIGAIIKGRFIHIPKSKGEGYITGFSWENKELRMLIRNYYLKEDVQIERMNDLVEGHDDVVFLLKDIFPMKIAKNSRMRHEQPSVFVSIQPVSSAINMPANTFFRSVSIAASRNYLCKLFGDIKNPLVTSILEGKENFAYETNITLEMVNTALEIVQLPVPESLASHFCKLKCEELLCHVFAELMQRELKSPSVFHVEDIKSIYVIKMRLLSMLHEPLDIALLAKEIGMSGAKMRKLFKQTFGTGIFAYYQSARMRQAAILLKQKRLSVSEVGYTMGFTNLSHFAREFEKRFGVKPKKYSTG